MRILQSALLAAALVGQSGASYAYTELFNWQGNGRSEVFTIDGKVGSWRAEWECEARSSVKIAILNANSGVPIDFLGASYRGERLMSQPGRFQFDTGGSFCRVTGTTMN